MKTTSYIILGFIGGSFLLVLGGLLAASLISNGEENSAFILDLNTNIDEKEYIGIKNIIINAEDNIAFVNNDMIFENGVTIVYSPSVTATTLYISKELEKHIETQQAGDCLEINFTAERYEVKNGGPLIKITSPGLDCIDYTPYPTLNLKNWDCDSLNLKASYNPILSNCNIKRLNYEGNTIYYNPGVKLQDSKIDSMYVRNTKHLDLYTDENSYINVVNWIPNSNHYEYNTTIINANVGKLIWSPTNKSQRLIFTDSKPVEITIDNDTTQGHK